MSLLGQLFGSAKRQPAAQVSNALDLVSYAAGLVSNPTDVDTQLDTVRMITSQLVPGQAPSPQDARALLGVYLQLEQYLATKEPLRTFTKDGLRARLSPELRRQLQLYETK